MKTYNLTKLAQAGVVGFFCSACDRAYLEGRLADPKTAEKRKAELAAMPLGKMLSISAELGLNDPAYVTFVFEADVPGYVCLEPMKHIGEAGWEAYEEASRRENADYLALVAKIEACAD